MAALDNTAGMRPVEKVKIVVDGKEVMAEKGRNLLDVCLGEGIDISYFCYHPGLSSPAVCRQCLVEVKGQTKLVPSCYTPVQENMEVITASQRVKDARAQMLEFTLVNHPIDCPICDKAGECTLQKLYMEWDGKQSRVSMDKVHKPKVVDLGPTVVLDAERCILCSRCIRVCDEVAGVHQLEMSFRGDHETLCVAPGQKLDNPYSLNTVDVCPVGALTSKDFRFTMRAWELYATPSVCTGCSTGCNIELHHHQGQVWRIVPRENRAVNQHWMCDEGRMTYKEIEKNRQLTARVGLGKGLPGRVQRSAEVILLAAKKIAGLVQKGGRLGVVMGAQVTNEALFEVAGYIDILSSRGVTVQTYLSGRSWDFKRQDSILRTADKNPNTFGASLFAGKSALSFDKLEEDLRLKKLDAVWMIGEDVPISEDVFASSEIWLKTEAYFVVQAVSQNVVAKFANAVLPACSFAETDGTFTNKAGIVQRNKRSLKPPYDVKTHLELVQAIGKSLMQELGISTELFVQRTAKESFEAMVQAALILMREDVLGTMQNQLKGYVEAQYGDDFPPKQLRFASSRG